MSDKCNIRQTSCLNRIGDDCFRLILQYNHIETLITVNLISTRANQVINQFATKYLPIVSLDLRRTDLCQRYSQTRISSVIPKLRLSNVTISKLSAMSFSKTLRVLDLTHNNLGAGGMRILASHLASLPCLQTLNLTNNYLDVEGMRFLASHLSSLPRLLVLDLAYNDMYDDEIEVLAPHLSSLPCLQTLNLEWNNLGIGGMKVLARHLFFLPQLQTLNLCDNLITSEGIKVLASHLSSIPRLQTLNLSWNLIGSEGMRYLASHLASTNVCSQLKTLNLHDTCLEVEGIAILSQLRRDRPQIDILGY